MNIKEKRNELGLTQVYVAKLVGVALSTYLLWERGVGNPTPENEKRLREVLKLESTGNDSGNHPR